MIYEVIWTSRFKKSYKLCKKRGLPLEELKSVVELLRTDQTLDEKFRDHELSGVFAGTRELHISRLAFVLQKEQRDLDAYPCGYWNAFRLVREISAVQDLPFFYLWPR